MLNNQLLNNEASDYDHRIDSFNEITKTILNYMEEYNKEKILLEMISSKLTKKENNKKGVYSDDEIQLALNYMEKNNILGKEEHGVVHACPSCSTIIKKVECHECKSSNIEKNQKILHNACGYSGNIDQFVTAEGLVCPNCDDDSHEFLSMMKDQEYHFYDSLFRCSDCGEEFKLYKTKGAVICTECKSSVYLDNSKLYNLEIYSNQF